MPSAANGSRGELGRGWREDERSSPQREDMQERVDRGRPHVWIGGLQLQGAELLTPNEVQQFVLHSQVGVVQGESLGE